MSKSLPFNVYLLKSGYNASNALKDNHKLEGPVDGNHIPQEASFFVFDKPAQNVWWTGYFGLDQTIKQSSKGGIMFLPIDTGERCFALSFGVGFHGLKDEAYEHDFGLLVTLNSVDPEKLKSTDTLQPGAARRQRIQSPSGNDLTFFDFDHDSSVLKSLAGKVKTKHAALFKNASGASSLNIKSPASPDGLAALCKTLLSLYESRSYEDTFPGIQNLAPVLDPDILGKLRQSLVDAVRGKRDTLFLAIPEIIDYRRGAHHALFCGQGKKSSLCDDVFIDNYYEYLSSRGFDLGELTYEDLKRHRLKLVDEDEGPIDDFSIVNCLIFETTLSTEKQTFHLADGKWYRVAADYVNKLRHTLDPLCISISLPAYAHASEGQYNEEVSNAVGVLCLDRENISPTGQKQVEPCDLYSVRNGVGILYHIKRSTVSGALSHLFNQGMNVIELLRLEPKSSEKLESLIRSRVTDGLANILCEPLITKKLEVVFAIITHKDPAAKSDNLPLFSKISLARCIRWLLLSGTNCNFGFIQDSSEVEVQAPTPVKESTIALTSHIVMVPASASQTIDLISHHK